MQIYNKKHQLGVLHIFINLYKKLFIFNI